MSEDFLRHTVHRAADCRHPPGMSTDSTANGEAGKTVQDYIDETPMWADATAVRYSPLTDKPM